MRSAGFLRAAFCVALLAVSLVFTSPPASAAAESAEPGITFESWLADLRTQALAEGVSQATLDRALAGLAPIERVVELDRRQPEFTLSFWRYLGNAVTETRIARGRALLEQHRDLLRRVEERYGVQPRFLVAFWGLETNFGETFGAFPVVGALATLAWDERRSDFFRQELLTALKVLDVGDISVAEMEGSWAGAMGHLQFMPSTFARYAVDADGDGRRDIWHSLPDVFASAANYLSSLGWKGDETWGREVRLPTGFDLANLSIATWPETVKPLADWAKLGLRRADGGPLPLADMQAALILPAGSDGPAFLVYDNYRRILQWNRSVLYAVAIGHLADRLIDLPALSVTPPAAETRLSVREVKEMQALLSDLGFAAGEPDGKLGPMTRAAIQAFQRENAMPADAFASPTLLARLRRAAMN